MINKKGQNEALITLIIIGAIVVFVIFIFAAIPLYRVWAQGLSGKAQLKEAEWNKQIAIEEARAEMESATLKKEADIIRAEGIAEANRIIAGSITENYLKYKFIEGLQTNDMQTIYIPYQGVSPVFDIGRSMSNN